MAIIDNKFKIAKSSFIHTQEYKKDRPSIIMHFEAQKKLK